MDPLLKAGGRRGDQDVPIGPGAFLQIILAAADRSVDRIRAQERAHIVTKDLAGIDFAAAYAAVPAFCMALMQNLSSDDQKEVGQRIQALNAASMGAEVKSKIMGLTLMNYVGPRVVRSAVLALAAQVKATAGIEIKPSQTTLGVTQTLQLGAEAKDSSGQVIIGKLVTWASQHPAIATVDAFGNVSGVMVGSAQITATADGVRADRVLTIS